MPANGSNRFITSFSFRACSDQKRDALLVERTKAMPRIKPPGAGVTVVARGIDAAGALLCKMRYERLEHRAADPLAPPLRVDRHVVELGDEAAARRRDRITDDARADDGVGTAREPHEAELGAREKQVERARQRLRSTVAVLRGGRAVMRIVLEKVPEQSRRIPSRHPGH